MPYNTKKLKGDVIKSPIPQYFNNSIDDFEPVQGVNGASRVLIYDAAGNPLLTAVNPGVFTLATKAPNQTLKTFTGTITTTVAVADPATVPTLSQAANAGSTLPAGNYYSVYTWQNANGETKVSAEAGPFALAASNNLVVTIPSLPAGATLAGIYIGTAAGNSTKQGTTAVTTFTQSTALAAGSAKPTTALINWNVQTLYTVTANKTLFVTDISITTSVSGSSILATLNASQIGGTSAIDTGHASNTESYIMPNIGTKPSVAGGAPFTFQARSISMAAEIAFTIYGFEQ